MGVPRSQEWAVATGARRSSLVLYRSLRVLVRRVLFWWFPVRVRGGHNLALDGPSLHRMRLATQ